MDSLKRSKRYKLENHIVEIWTILMFIIGVINICDYIKAHGFNFSIICILAFFIPFVILVSLSFFYPKVLIPARWTIRKRLSKISRKKTSLMQIWL